MKTQKDFTALKQEINNALTNLSRELSSEELHSLKSDMAKLHARHLTKGVIHLAKLYVERHDYDKALRLLQVAKLSPLKDEKYHRLFGNSTCAMKIEEYEEKVKSEKLQIKPDTIIVTSVPNPAPYRAPVSTSGNTSNILRLMTDAAYIQTFLTNQDTCTSGHPTSHHHNHHGHHNHHNNHDANISSTSNSYETSNPTHSHHTYNSTISEPSHHHNHPTTTYHSSHHNDTSSQAHHVTHDTGSSYGHGHSSFFNDTSSHHNASSFAHQDMSSHHHDTSNSFNFN
ncbi:hypothetical protein ACNVED_04275 [Legionella sp. D16C41]|uniref:hypothetical protein n=1 Tax=Legionella sp. D16C41 TaxID=3402688 RepID=UPI003AF7532B